MLQKNKIHHQYTMDNEPLNSIDTCVYLGVTVNSKLRWNQHIDQISAAANRMLVTAGNASMDTPSHLHMRHCLRVNMADTSLITQYYGY